METLENKLGPEIRVVKSTMTTPVGKPITWERHDLVVNHDTREEFRAAYEKRVAQYVGESAAGRAAFVVDELLQDAVDHQDGHVNLFSLIYEDRIVLIAHYQKEYDMRQEKSRIFEPNGELYTAEFGDDLSYAAEHGRGGAIVKALAGNLSKIEYGKGVCVHVPVKLLLQ